MEYQPPAGPILDVDVRPPAACRTPHWSLMAVTEAREDAGDYPGPGSAAAPEGGSQTSTWSGMPRVPLGDRFP
jgi:hypothetical protein